MGDISTAEGLDNINRHLNDDDKLFRPYRRALILTQTVKKDLVPILINNQLDSKTFNSVIRLMVNMTLPMECLFSLDNLDDNNDEGIHIISEIERSLNQTTDLFKDTRMTRQVMETLSTFVTESSNICSTDVTTVNNCLLLLRNILHIPSTNFSSQNQILWNLFSQNLDHVLLQLISHKESSSWNIIVVQLIALIYKDQHVVALQGLLKNFMDTTMSESSEDNESNVSPSNGSNSEGIHSSCNSSEMEYSIEISNAKDEDNVKKDSSGYCTLEEVRSSASDGNFKKGKTTSPQAQAQREVHARRRKRRHSATESTIVTDILKKYKINTSGSSSAGSSAQAGYKSNEKYTSDTSSSSENTCNNEKQRRKPHKSLNKPQPKKEPLTHREKNNRWKLALQKRDCEKILKVKAMETHVPTDDDITELLKDFTVDFLMDGYSKLVKDVLNQMLNKGVHQMDKSHFLWLITFFLKFTGLLEIDLTHVNYVLSFQTLSYLTFVGVEELELLELCRRDCNKDFSPNLRRMHLVITGLREFSKTLEIYDSITTLTISDKEKIRLLHFQSCHAANVRQLMLLLLRRYNPVIQPIQYLSDLVLTNHKLLQKIELVEGYGAYLGAQFNMTEHVKQFANKELMGQYGYLLDNFSNNSPKVNDCIFTLMHHIAGDLKSPEILCVPSILATFKRIWETEGSEGDVCEEWTDLIEYIIQTFIHTMATNPSNCAGNMVDSQDNASNDYGFTKKQAKSLLSIYTKVVNNKDPIGAVIEFYSRTKTVLFPRVAIIQELMSQGIISHVQFMNFMYMKSMMLPYRGVAPVSVEAEIGSEIGSERWESAKGEQICESEVSEDSVTNDAAIQMLIDCILKMGKGGLIQWLQEALLDACRVKMYPKCIIPTGSRISHEPVPFYYNFTEQSIPLVPWNRDQEQGLQTESFILLLHKLGFHLPADLGKLFPRIPFFWSADHMFCLASKLGPIQPNTLKFTIEELEVCKKIEEGTNDVDMVSSDSDMDIALVGEKKSKQSCFDRVEIPSKHLQTPDFKWKLHPETGDSIKMASDGCDSGLSEESEQRAEPESMGMNLEAPGYPVMFRNKFLKLEVESLDGSEAIMNFMRGAGSELESA